MRIAPVPVPRRLPRRGLASLLFAMLWGLGPAWAEPPAAAPADTAPAAAGGSQPKVPEAVHPGEPDRNRPFAQPSAPTVSKPPAPSESRPESPAEGRAPAEPAHGAGSAETDSGTTPVPKTESKGLDSDLVYAVLVAELAARRGDLATAFNYYLNAAQLSKDPKMAELAVRSAMSAEDDAAAGRGVALWLKLDPDSVGAHLVAALLRIRAGDKEGALIELSRIVELSGQEGAPGYDRIVGILAHTSDKASRVELMQALVDRDSGNPEAQQALAVVAASAARNDLAESAARRALELKPNWDKSQIFLVRLLISEDKRDEARKLLEAYVAASPDDRQLRMLYGQFLVEEKDLAHARNEFEHVLGNQPKEPDVLFAVGILSLELDDLDAARDYLNRLYDTGERRDDAAFYLGQVEEKAGHPDVALDWYAKAGGSNETDARLRMALLRAKQGDVARAREILQQMRDESPESAKSLYVAEAEILDQAGHKDEALGVYAAALKAFPDNTDLLYARAMYEVRIDRVGLAEADLRRIVELDPKHADALNALGYTLADRTDRYAEAEDLIERAYQLKPDEPAIQDSMGWVNYKLGHLDTALEFLRKALAAMDDGEVAAHLGEVLWAMGRHDEAWQVWDAALKAHPDQPYLLETVGRHRVTKTEPRE
jgi:tetratricopeptide (TPR) repeat protein